jgi:hypothetical protein
MDPKEELAALGREAAALIEKANGPSFTEADAARAEQITKRHGELSAMIQRKSAAASSLSALGGGQSVQRSNDNPGEMVGKSLGERFVNSAEYRDFQKSHPFGLGSNSDGESQPIRIQAKAIGERYVSKADPAPLNYDTTGNARAVRTNDVEDLVYRPARRLLDLVTRGTTNLPWFQYRQIISKTNGASLTNEAKDTLGTTPQTGLKPLSTLTTQTADARAFTYADGMEVTNQELSDDGIIRALIDATLRENLEIEMERVLLNGAGTADEPAGILATSGVLQQAFVTDMPTTVRKAITKLTTTSGANIKGVVLHPSDDETWDLLKDLQNRYLGNGPFGIGPKSAWGFERINSQALTPGQALVGDFSTIQLLQLEALTVLAFNQHKDYAQRNLTYIRAEERAVQLIRNPARLCIVDLTA